MFHDVQREEGSSPEVVGMLEGMVGVAKEPLVEGMAVFIPSGVIHDFLHHVEEELRTQH